jgi:hypothetical protein
MPFPTVQCEGGSPHLSTCEALWPGHLSPCIPRDDQVLALHCRKWPYGYGKAPSHEDPENLAFCDPPQCCLAGVLPPLALGELKLQNHSKFGRPVRGQGWPGFAFVK